MFAICIESSHQKGMGHLFRAMNFINLLKQKNDDFIVVINNDAKSESILIQNQIQYLIVDLNDIITDWESKIIKKYNIKYWINDRLETDIQQSKNIKKNNIKFITFDDISEGAKLADLSFGLMPCFYNKLKGEKVLSGLEYFILNDQINYFKRERVRINKVIITLGGSDTYGVTFNIVKALIQKEIDATIIIGPSFEHYEELNKMINNKFEIKHYVPSLIEEFYNYDLAITGGGITPFEANACGLPCMIIANEHHEEDNGKFLRKIGSSDYLGYYMNIDYQKIGIGKIDLNKMSKKGLEMFGTDGAVNIYNTIIKNG